MQKKEELTDTHANEKGDQIDSKINDAQKAIEDKKQRIQKNKDRYQQYQKYYKHHLKHVKNTSEELLTLTEWLKNGHEPPGIVISDTIEKDTKIVSKRCEMILDKEHSHVYIKEIQSNDEGAKFQIESLSDAPN
ncbi:MAG: hypothetical protein OMM_06652 [Candidatus Magnetoglobus multicellularis str. Araruama]|uniref:Uncharacterized protein n=1 Tax=Candidatus Magnetoglobus multicellularis str. Araruama TaxID=890399 RepID=A0A1V1PG67_9BACT|nr:MAG: hypothetical protein OMM_06652 [Candidatus Magnetoglobus multicellularis str. Araruama]